MLWEFDIGEWHNAVFQDTWGVLWLKSTPLPQKKRKGIDVQAVWV